jgi:hypothetical protein
MGLYKTQNCLGQSGTLMLFLSKNINVVSSKNKIGISFCPVFHIAPFSPTQILEKKHSQLDAPYTQKSEIWNTKRISHTIFDKDWLNLSFSFFKP